MYDKLIQKAVDGGVTFVGNVAEVIVFGCVVSFDWQYDPVSATARILCTHKPIVIGRKTIEKKIYDLVEQARRS